MKNPERSDAQIRRLLSEAKWLRPLAAALTDTRHDADDVSQAVLLKGWRALASDEAPRSMRAWFSTVLGNEVRAQGLRGRRRREREASSWQGRAEASRPTDEIVAEIELKEIVSKLLCELPMPVRDVLVLRFHEGLSGAAIAHRLGIPAGTVRWRLKCGLESIREGLDERHGGDRAAWLSAVGLISGAKAGGKVTAATSLASSVVAFTATKMLAAAAGVVAALLLLAVLVPRGDPSSIPPISGGDDRKLDVDGLGRLAVTDAAGENGRVDGLAPPGASLDAEVVVANEEAAPAAKTELRVRVVDQAGIPLPGSTVLLYRSEDARKALSARMDSLSPLEQIARWDEYQVQIKEIIEEAVAETTTDGGGLAVLQLPTPQIARCRLEVRASNFGELSQQVELLPDSVVDLGTVSIKRMGEIRCRVFDESGPTDAPWVNLRHVRDDGQRKARWTRREEGPVTIFKVAEGGTFRMITQRGHPPVLQEGPEVNASLGRSLTVDFMVKAPEPINTVEIHVFGPDGKPAQAEVMLTSLEGGRTIGLGADQAGVAQIYRPSLLEERMTARAVDPNLLWEPVEVTIEPPYADIVIRFESGPTRTLTVQVLRRGGEPEPEAFMAIQVGDALRAVKPTDPDRPGEFSMELPGCPDDRVSLLVTSDGGSTETFDQLLVQELPDPWVIRLGAPPSVRGTVLSGGEPVANAKVRVARRLPEGEWISVIGGVTRADWWTATEGRTNSAGAFSVVCPVSGDVVVHASHREFGDALAVVEDDATSTEPKGLELRLQPRGSVVGTAAGSGDLSLEEDDGVLANHEYYAPRFVARDASGRFALTDLPVGDWEVVPRSVSRTMGRLHVLEKLQDWGIDPNVRVLAGERTNFDIGPPTTGLVDGRILLVGDVVETLLDAKLTATPSKKDALYRNDRYRRTATLGSDGTFKIMLGRKGPQDLSLSLPGSRASVGLEDVDLAREGTIELRLAAVEVTVPPGYRFCELRCESPGRQSLQQEDVSDEGGVMRLVGLEGAATLRVRGPYLRRLEQRFTLQAGEIKAVTLR